MSFFGRLFGRRHAAGARPARLTVAGPLCSEPAMELAGFFVAHAVWSISDGEILIPLAGAETAAGQRNLIRFASDRIEDGVAAGQKWLAENPDRAARAVLVFDGFITLAGQRSDALLAMVRDFAPGNASATWAVPYRPANSPGGFAVHRPKLLAGPESADLEHLAAAFWRGVTSHEKGVEVWNRHLDESR